MAAPHNRALERSNSLTIPPVESYYIYSYFFVAGDDHVPLGVQVGATPNKVSAVCWTEVNELQYLTDFWEECEHRQKNLQELRKDIRPYQEYLQAVRDGSVPNVTLEVTQFKSCQPPEAVALGILNLSILNILDSLGDPFDPT